MPSLPAIRQTSLTYDFHLNYSHTYSSIPQEIEEERRKKAAEDVARAKEVAEKQRQLSDAAKTEALEKLQEKLDTAAARKDEAEKKRLAELQKQRPEKQPE